MSFLNPKQPAPVSLVRRKICSSYQLKEEKPFTSAGRSRIMRRINSLFSRGRTVWDYLPDDVKASDGVFDIRLNDRRLNDIDLHSVRPGPGDVITIIPIPQEFWISLIVTVVLVAAYLIYEFGYNRPHQERLKKAGFVGATYLFDRFLNTTKEGTPVPIVYGTHRIAGHYISQFTRSEFEGTDMYYCLMGACEGEVCSLTDFWINGVDYKDMLGSSSLVEHFHSKDGTVHRFLKTHYNPGESWDPNRHEIHTRRGTVGQGVIDDFKNSTTTVSYDQLMVSGTTYTLNGTAQADKAIIKLQFTPYGLWHRAHDGSSHRAKFKYQYRFKTSSGSWGDYPWYDNQFDRRRKEPFSLFVEIAFPSTDTWDIQIVKLSGDSNPTDENPTFQDVYIKEFQQLKYADQRYPSLALYAIKAVGTANLMGDVPQFTVLAQGLKIHQMQSAARFIAKDLPATAAAETGTSAPYIRTYTCAGHPFKVGDKVTVTAETDWPGADSFWSIENALVIQVTANTFKVEAQTLVDEPWPGGTVATAGMNNADVILDLMYSPVYGLAYFKDREMEFGVTVLSGTFAVGNAISGPGGFQGVIRRITGTAPNLALLVRQEEGLPVYGETLTDSGGATGTMEDVSRFAALDLASFWTLHQWCDEWVAGQTAAQTTVDADSAAGTSVLYVLGTIGFRALDIIRIAEGTAREEFAIVHSVQAGVSITIKGTLQYTHTMMQADVVRQMEKRCQCDIVFDGAMPAWEAIKRILDNAMAWPVMEGSKLFARVIKDESPAALVSMGNVERGEVKFSLMYPPVGDRPNICNVTYLDREKDYLEAKVSIEDDLAITQDTQLVPLDIEVYGITRRSEAGRFALRRLKEMRYRSTQAEWNMDISAIHFQAGDVIQVQHDVPGWGTQGGRIVSATSNTATIEKTVTLGAGTYYIRVVHADGSEEEKEISSPAGEYRVLGIVGSWSAVPGYGAVYAVGLSVARRMRILQIEWKGNFKAKVMAIRDHANIYSAVPGAIPDFIDSELPDPRALPPDVTNITCSEHEGVDADGNLRSWLDVHFVKPQYKAYSHAEVWWRQGLGFRDSVGRQLEDGETPGNYTFYRPYGVCSDGDYVYVSDTFNHRIVKYTFPDLQYVAELGTKGTGNDNFACPMGICTDGTYLWICDTDNHRVKKHLCSDLSYVGEVGAYGTGNGQFNYPMDVDANGTHIFVIDTNNHRIQKFTVGSPNPTWVATFGSQGSGDDQFERPGGICVAGDHVYIADTGNYRVKKHLSDDTLAFVSKAGTQGYDTDKFCAPRGIDTDGTDLFVADGGYDGTDPTVLYSRIMARACSDLAAAGIFPGGISAWGGPVGKGLDQLDLPENVACTPNGEYYLIADTRNGRIVRRALAADTGDWTFAGEAADGYLRVTEPFQPGTYVTAAVVSVSSSGSRKMTDDAPQDSIMMGGSGLTPRDVSVLNGEPFSADRVRLWWDKSSDPLTKFYEIRRGSDWQSGEVLAAKYDGTSVLLDQPAGSTATYWIKAVSSGLKYSETAKSVTVNFSMVVGCTHDAGAVAMTANARTG